MNYPCSASIDELKNDPFKSRLEIYQREELVESVKKDLVAYYKKNPEEMLVELDPDQQFDLLKSMTGMIMYPQDNDRLEAYLNCAKAITEWIYKIADRKANERADELGL